MGFFPCHYSRKFIARHAPFPTGVRGIPKIFVLSDSVYAYRHARRNITPLENVKGCSNPAKLRPCELKYNVK